MRNQTRKIKVRDLEIGGGAPVSVQSMCATHTRDIDATVRQIEALRAKGADLVRVAVDNKTDAAALAEIRKQTKARLVVDLQENYLLAEFVAPHVDKIRYNPGHLHHLEKEKPVREKVAWIAGVAKQHGNALRVGVNCGSVAPEFLERFAGDHVKAIVESAAWHCELLDELKFTNYVVSLKDSDPRKVVFCNREFSKRRPDVPIHLGVTEAGLLPDGVIKTRVAFEQLLPQGIGDTLRVSLTLTNADKAEEVVWGKKILEDVAAGRFISAPDFGKNLNIISCPSCSRVENEDFVKLAMDVKEMSAYARGHHLTIAVMGCRVNGPGETDDADLGLWCGPSTVTLKRKAQALGSYRYHEILPVLKSELDRLIVAKN
jgi:(E)-4-hydroxy-3-methylbut-2-enyl-diphosphate synthase